jgi:integrase
VAARDPGVSLAHRRSDAEPISHHRQFSWLPFSHCHHGSPHGANLDQCAPEACDDEVELLRFINFALMTGMRRAEIVNAVWGDVDLERGQITVSNKPGFQTKSRRSRVIPISANLRKMLMEMRAEPQNPDTPLFRSQYWWIGKKFRKAARRAGLPDTISIHSMRHTFASFLVMGGVDLATVKAILGHSDIKVTMIYSHLTPGHLAHSVDRLPY